LEQMAAGAELSTLQPPKLNASDDILRRLMGVTPVA